MSQSFYRHCNSTSRSCARIVLVQASHQSNQAKKLTTYAVLDDQSTDVFTSDSLLEQLEVATPEVDLQINTNYLRLKLIQNKESNWTIHSRHRKWLCTN